MAAGLSAFRRYLPVDVVRMLASEGIRAEPGGKVQLVTVLFADIAGFTGLAETLGEGVFPLLTQCFEIVSAAITAHGGTIDKSMGDGVMAFWERPIQIETRPPRPAAPPWRTSTASLRRRT